LALVSSRFARTCSAYLRGTALSELDETLHAGGVELCFAEMKDPVKDKLKRFGLFARLGDQAFFATIEEAVSAYRTKYAVG